MLLLDEVMAGLNATEVDEALDLLRTVNERGVTLIVVEHLMKAIMSISTTIVVLAEGKKIAEGAPAEVLASPRGHRSVSRHALTPRAQRAERGAPRVSVLRVEGLGAGYGDTQVLWDVSFEVAAGRDRRDHRFERRRQVDAARRDQRARANVVGSGDATASAISPARTSIGSSSAGVVQVPQGRRLFGSLTVEENLLMGAYLRRDSEVDSDLEKLLDAVAALARAVRLSGRAISRAASSSKSRSRAR